MIKKAVLDFGAFVGATGLPVVKELSVIDVESGCAQHWIFKPPRDQVDLTSTVSRHNYWVGKYYHGIDFQSGHTDYAALDQVLDDACSNVLLLYAPNKEKALALEKLFGYSRAVFSLEDFGCPALSSETMGQRSDEASKPCLYHLTYAPRFNCTLKNVQQLACWCRQNLDRIDMNSPAIREKTFGDWKCAHPTARALSEEGFVRVHGDKDSTKCVYCNVVLHRWQPADNVEEDHDFNSPFCKFTRRKRQLAKLQQLCGLQVDSGVDEVDRAVTENELFEICGA